MVVNSLICWGGATGKAIGSVASNILTITNHGLRTGTAVVATANAGNLVSGTPYYANVLTVSTFYLYDTLANATNGTATGRIAATSTTQALKSKTMLDYVSVYPTRWGTEIYSGLSAWYTARFAANRTTPSFDTEAAEIGEAFSEYSSTLTLDIYCASAVVTTMVNAVRSTGFHNKLSGNGYVLKAQSTVGISSNMDSAIFDGIEVEGTVNNTILCTQGALSSNVIIRNNIFKGFATATGQTGIRTFSSGVYHDNIILGMKGPTTWGGILVPQFGYAGATLYNNTVTKCDTGVWIAADSQCQFFNNNVVGNTLNYGGIFPNYILKASNNSGEVADRKTLTFASAGTTITFAVAHGRANNSNFPQSIKFTNSGGALPANIDPAVTYYVKSVPTTLTMTIGATYAGAAIVFADAGSGTHYTTTVLTSVGDPVITDTTCFANWANNDFTPSVGSPLINAGLAVLNGADTDNGGTFRPAYQVTGTAAWDIGAIEYNDGSSPDGRPPLSVSFTGILSGSTIRIFPTGSQTAAVANTNVTADPLAVTGVSASTYDYTIFKDGYLPIRQTGTVFADGLVIPINQVTIPAYQTSSGLTYGTTATINTSTKRFALTTATTPQNFYSFWLEQYRRQAALFNLPFPLSNNGPNSIRLLMDYEFSAGSIDYLSRDGISYYNTAGTQTAAWAAILTVGVLSGMRVRYQQTDGGTTIQAVNTSGNMDELIQIYGDATHGSINYTGYLVLKVQEMGYDQAESDAVSLYGTLEDQLYVCGLSPLPNSLTVGNPALAAPPTITDHAGSPVTWNSKSFSVTVTDSAAGNTGTDIMRWLRYYFETGGAFQGKDAFCWHDIVQQNGTSFKGVRGKLYGDAGSALKGVRVVKNDGTTSHADFNLHTSDDGTTYAPPLPPAAVNATVLTDSRVRLYNVTTSAEIDNVFVTSPTTAYQYVITTEASLGDTLELRVCKKGRQTTPAYAVWGASGVTFLVSQPEETIYTGWGIDGATCTEYALDLTGIVHIDANDVDGNTLKTRFAAWISYALTTADGIRYLYGAVSYLAANSIRINVPVLNLLINNINPTTALVFTDNDVRLFRSDGSSIIDPASYSIHNDYTGVPDVVTVSSGSGLSTDEHNQLFGIQTGIASVNLVKVAGTTINGAGTELSPWGP